MLPFQRFEILLKASDDSGAWRSITEMESSLGKGSAVSKFALIHHADCIHWLSESFARSGSKGHTSVLYYIHQSKTNVSTEKKNRNSSTPVHSGSALYSCCTPSVWSIRLSSHSLGWCTQAHIPLLLRKRMRDGLCLLRGNC